MLILSVNQNQNYEPHILKYGATKKYLLKKKLSKYYINKPGRIQTLNFDLKIYIYISALLKNENTIDYKFRKPWQWVMERPHTPSPKNGGQKYITKDDKI